MGLTRSTTTSKFPRLTADLLATDLGIRSALAQDCIAEFSRAISRNKSVQAPWRDLFDRVWGSCEKKLIGPLGVLARKLGVGDLDEPLHVLFALQTYYALLLDLLVKQFEQLRNYEIIDPIFSWCLESDCPKVQTGIARITEALGRYELDGEGSTLDAGGDLLKPLHHSIFARAIRHPLGEYYTPDWLAEHVLDQIGFDGVAPGRLLDPSCGSGTFLMAAIRRIRRASQEARGGLPCPALPLLEKIVRNVAGIDLNPLAAMSARANYLIAIRDLLPPDAPALELPVYLGDSILGIERELDRFDFIAGNPPWIAWDNLPDEYREATKPLWEKYGLFSLSGNAARHGGGKKDLSMLMLYATADRHLNPGGRLGFVITQTLFQTKGAGDGFRRFRLGDGSPLAVLRVDDLTAIKPFEDAANWTSVVVLKKGSPTVYPVAYYRWAQPVGQICNLSEAGQITNLSYERIPCGAEPIEAGRPTSPWLIRSLETRGDSPALLAAARSDYEAHLGANSGGANGVYWVELLGEADGGVRIRNVTAKCKKAIPTVEFVIEPDLLYPLLRWSDLARYAPLPRCHLLLVQDCGRRVGLDETELRTRYPRTFAYLQQFEPLLIERAAFRRYQRGGPFYSMYNVGSYTAADHKVVWRRMDKELTAAVAEPVDHPLLGRRPVVPQETCVLVACETSDESHYLCSMLNSDASGRLLAAHSVRSGKGFGTPSILDYLPIRRFDGDNLLHRQLSERSRDAHELRKKPDFAFVEKHSLETIQAEIDRLAEKVFAV